jgi:hypothetical protein
MSSSLDNKRWELINVVKKSLQELDTPESKA